MGLCEFRLNNIEMNNDFPVIENLTHLNHAAVGPWPRQTQQAIEAFARENVEQGTKDYPLWLKKELELKDLLVRLINAESRDEIALVKSTSEGLSFIASGLSWNKGDNVVGIKQEFPSNRFSWESLASEGVEFRKLDLEHCDDDIEQALFNLCDTNTRLISISAVQYYSGLRMDLKRIGEFCHDQDILFCVDAIQQIGALQFDVNDIHADFAVADGHKWMLAPEGLGLLYVNASQIERLKPSQYGWHMVEGNIDYTQQSFTPALSARRFESGSPNMLGIHALYASIDYLLNTGMATVEEKLLDKTDYLINQLQHIKALNLASPTDSHRRSGIVTFHCPKHDPDALYRHLMQNNVLCAARGGGVRLSPHFYTPRQQLDQALTMISNWLENN